MTSGRITSITPDWRGDTLASGVLAGALVLPVTDVTDFDEDDTAERWLILPDLVPRQYVDVDDDANTITLASPVGVTYEAGLPVIIWDPTVAPDGAPVVEYRAEVMTDRGSVGATIPHEKVQLAGVDLLIGASVTLDEDEDDEVFVDQIKAREARASVAGSFATDTGYDDIEIIPGDDNTPAALRFLSDSPHYNLDDPAGLSCWDEPGFGGDGGDFYVRLLGARAIGDGVNARPQIRLYTAYDVTGTVSTVDLLSGGSDADFGFLRFFIKGTMKGIVDVDGVHSSDGLFIDSLAGGGITGANINDNGKVVRDTSSERYKQNVEPLTLDQAKVVLDLEPVTFEWRSEMNMGERRMPGFIAEQAHAAGASLWVTYANDDEAGDPDGFRYPQMVAAHNALLKDVYARLEALEVENAELKAQLPAPTQTATTKRSR